MFRSSHFYTAAMLLVCATAAQAQTWPAKPIRVVVPYPAGGTSDILTRMIGAKLTESWGQQVIAVSSEKREPMFPQVPTVAETPGLDGYNAGSWQGIIAPGKLPADIQMKLYTEVRRIVGSADFSEKLTSQGSRPQAKTPQDTGAWLASEKEKWAKVVKESGLKVE